VRATRADVAKQAGVSVATVSYVLNNTCPVKEETRSKVLAAARVLNYIPDMRARSMATNRTMQIAVIVSNLTDPVSCEIVEYFIQRAAQNGYFVNISTKNGSIQQNIRNVISQHVDGVFILSVPDELEADMIYNLTDTEIRAVVGVPLFKESSRRQVCSIEMAQDDAFLKALAYLREKGHRRIACLINIANDTVEQRMLPIYQELPKRGMNIDFLINTVSFNNDYEAGYALGLRLLNRQDHSCTAVLATSNILAKGCIDVFVENALDVPGDISCMALKSGTIMPILSGLPITTIVIDYRVFAEKAFDMLQNFIEGNMINHYKMSCSLREGKTVRQLQDKK
jgi:LacI family transcriptional regulator